MFKNTIATCLKNTNLATPVCEDYRELYKSRPQRSLLQEVHFLFDTQVEDEQLGIHLYSISYAWGTLRLAHRRPKIIKGDGKIVQKDATIYITYESRSRNPLITYSQLSKDDPPPPGSKFEYIFDQTIRVQNTHICITETTNDYVYAAACSEESTRWILEKGNSYLISQESGMCFTIGVEETLKLEQCALEGDARKNQQWFFQTINTNPDVIENFPDVTLQDLQEVRLEQRKAVTTTINSTYLEEVPIKGETESGLPQNIEEFSDKVKFDISKMHEQYKISIETEHENRLAKEIRDVYCQRSTIKKTQAVILAQSNGILAASALGLPIYYGADPDIEEDSQTIAHRAAAENNKLLIRILRYYKYKFSSYNSLGETPLMVAIAYGHEEVASYLWISSNVAQIAKDNSTVLHYAAKHGNNSLARAACERKIHININQTTRPGNYMALHLATMYRQDHIVNILLEHGAYPNITDVNGNNPQDYVFDEQRRNIFEDWDYIRGHKRKTSGSE
ncbi:Uncharacterized protein APZ42_030454 [Daphnia magna]|uniref:Ricin B lectin domain-containing protein n=1 Tax=Daphnia magna TaxID=35525 RepID=A0A164NRA6_9CRUS|nr:Uncharacterized protein APZ42_030454 [Daphnia magna]